MAWYEQEGFNQTQSSMREWALAGRNAAVEKGGFLIVRFLPHPLAADCFDPETGNESRPYSENAPAPFVRTAVHWVSTVTGMRRRVFCPRGSFDVLGRQEDCPICVAGVSPQRRVAAANALAVDRKSGSYYTYLGDFDVRIIILSWKVFDDILSMIRGAFGVGDITHPFTGRRIAMERPVGLREPWRLRAEPQPTPIFSYDSPAEVLDFVRGIEPVQKLLGSVISSYKFDDIDYAATANMDQAQAGQQQAQGQGRSAVEDKPQQRQLPAGDFFGELYETKQ